jgi:uncharacterized membrane protein
MSKTRLEAFSDGVFAIVATLLVLEIHVPQLPHGHGAGELTAALLALAPKVAIWAASFAFASVYWVNHHQFIAALASVDRPVLFTNAIFLMALSFLPFPTALLGEYPRAVPALTTFGMSMAGIGAVFFVLRSVAGRRGLLAPVPAHVRRAANLRGAAGPILYLAGAAAGFASPVLAWAVFLGVPVLYVGSSAADRHAIRAVS